MGSGRGRPAGAGWLTLQSFSLLPPREAPLLHGPPRPSGPSLFGVHGALTSPCPCPCAPLAAPPRMRAAYDKRKYMWKLLYTHMLGYDTDFGHKQAMDLIAAPG